MDSLEWVKSSGGVGNSYIYEVEIGNIHICCRMYARKRWCCIVYLGDRWISDTSMRQSLELAKLDGERLMTRYLLGDGLTIMNALKKLDLLEIVLSEVGIDC